MKMSSLLIGGCLLGALLPLGYRIAGLHLHTLDMPLVTLALYTLLRPQGFSCNSQSKQSVRNRAVCIRANFDQTKLTGIDGALIISLVVAFFSSIVSFNYINTIDTLATFVRGAVFYSLVCHLLIVRHFSFRDLALLSGIFWLVLSFIGTLQYSMQNHIGSVSTYFGDTRPLDSWYESYYLTSIKIVGTAANPNIFALWIVFLTTVLNVYFCIIFRHRLFAKLLLLLINLILLFLLFASASRGGFIYYILSISLLYVIMPNVWGGGAWLRIFTRVVVLIFLLLTTGAMISGMISGFDIQSVPLLAKGAVIDDDPRWTFYAYSWDLLQHPIIFLFGTGFRAFYPALYAFDVDLGWHSNYGLVDYFSFSSGPHNLFLNALVEGGVFFFIAVVSVFIVGVVLPFRALRSVTDIDQRAALVFSVVSVPSLAVNLATEDFAFYAPVLFFVLMPFAMGSASVSSVRSHRRGVAAGHSLCTKPHSSAASLYAGRFASRLEESCLGTDLERPMLTPASAPKGVSGRMQIRRSHDAERRTGRMARTWGPS